MPSRESGAREAYDITDTIEVCRWFPQVAVSARIAVRLDTHGGRFILAGTGFPAAAIWRTRDALDPAGPGRVRIVASSSGFRMEKCRMMADAYAPIDVVGSGSIIPRRWAETCATADIVTYGGTARVKIGREFLLRTAKQRQGGLVS